MKSAEVDTSGFQNIVLMLVGVLMIMLIASKKYSENALTNAVADIINDND